MCDREVAPQVDRVARASPPSQPLAVPEPRLPPDSLLPTRQMFSACVILSFSIGACLGMAGSIAQFPFSCLSSLGELGLVSVTWGLVNYKLVSAHVSFIISLAFIFLGLHTFLHLQKNCFINPSKLLSYSIL